MTKRRCIHDVPQSINTFRGVLCPDAQPRSTDMSTAWKSLAAGFAVGAVSTGAFAIGLEAIGIMGWVGSLLYIFYRYKKVS